MAALSYLGKPLHESPHFQLIFADQQPNPSKISSNLPLPRTSFQFSETTVNGTCLRRSHVVKNSLIESSGVYNVPLLSASEAIESLRRSRESYKSTQRYLAMYSSVFGGITTDQAAMVIPMDDHMVHRGHGVFDTAAIVDGILSGCTAKRVLELVGNLAAQGKVKGVKVRDVTVEEGKRAVEMMLIGSGVVVRPVLQWDDQVIGDGKEGVVTESLRMLILEDMKSGPSTVRTVVP